MRKQLLFCTLAGILFTISAGTLSHFFYEWSGKNFFIGLIAPVSESVWEHMKMAFFPMLLYCGFENILLKKQFPSIIKANVYAIFTGTFSIPVLFFTYTGILGTDILACDIAVFCTGIILAFIISYRLARKTHPKGFPQTNIPEAATVWPYISILLLLLCFIIFTLYPPDIGLFQIPE